MIMNNKKKKTKKQILNKRQQRKSHKRNNKETNKKRNNKMKMIIRIFKIINKMRMMMVKVIKMAMKVIWNKNKMRNLRLLICFTNKEIVN